MTSPVTDAELWRRVLDARMSDVHTAMPGEVISFDASLQTIEVQPMIKNVIVGEEGEQEESYPRLYNVPVVYPRTSAIVVAFPLKAGDIVTLIFNEWPIDAFREKGKETHPIDLERHGFGGAIALPGGPYPRVNPISETVDAMLVGYDGGALVKVKSDGTIEAGSTAGSKQFVALDTKTKTEISALRNTVDALITAYNAHIHVTTATISAGPVGVLSPTASSATPPAAVGDVGSTKVKAQE
jgi:hypothetical protein